jgi:hypothetical protein
MNGFSSSAFTLGDQMGLSSPPLGSLYQSFQDEVKMEDEDRDQSDVQAQREPSSGPVRNQNRSEEGTTGEGSSKVPIAAPVKSACTFCRSR